MQTSRRCLYAFLTFNTATGLTHDVTHHHRRHVSSWVMWLCMLRPTTSPPTKSFPFFICHHRRTRRGVGGADDPRAWKNSGQTLFSGQAQVAQKSWVIKNISIQWKIPGQLCFSSQAQVAQKSWMIKNMYSVQWIQGTLCFSGQAQVAQNSWMLKVYSIEWKISGELCFPGQAQSCSKILNGKKYIQYSEQFQDKLCF